MRKTITALIVLALIMLASPAKADDSGCNWGNYSRPNTTYLSPSSGDSNQTAINSAIAAAPSGGSVFLKSGTYIISGPITVKSDVTLEGDKDAVVKLKNHAGWKTAYTSSSSGTCNNYYVPLIGSSSPFKTGVQNVEIKCFTIDGNLDGNISSSSESCYYPSPSTKKRYNSCLSDCEARTDDRWMGLGYYVMVFFTGSTNVSVHDMVMQNGFTDGFKLQSSSNIRFYNNTVTRLGHDGLFVASSNGVKAYNNKVWARTNSAFRMQDTYDVEIHDNYITNFGVEPSGYLAGRHYGSGPGIELDKQKAASKMTNIYVYNNVFTSTWGPSIWLAAVADPNSPSIYIHHNVFYQSGMNQSISWVGGIVSNHFTGVVVENNTFDESYAAALSTYPMISGSSQIIFRNNIVTNTKKSRGTGVGGYGIYNYNSNSTITSQNNCFYNNVSGNTSGSIASSGDFTANPLYAKVGSDYHLQSIAGRWDPGKGDWVSDLQNSPGIDAGKTDSSYGNEPENNGDRINVGRYGNTSQASLTGNEKQIPPPADPVSDVFDVNFSGDYSGGGTNNAPKYWFPTEALLDPDPYVPVDPALPVPEAVLKALFPELADSPESARSTTCRVVPDSAGFIPCGKYMDDPATDWNECNECTMCSMVLMGQLTIEFLIKIAAVIAALALILSGFMYVFAIGSPQAISEAKSIIKHSLTGFIIIFVSWVIIDTILATLGYIDPIEGSWHTIC